MSLLGKSDAVPDDHIGSCDELLRRFARGYFSCLKFI
jgi:hypothetical protein